MGSIFLDSRAAYYSKASPTVRYLIQEVNGVQIRIECTSTEVVDLVSGLQLVARQRELFSNEIKGVADSVCEIIQDRKQSGQIWK